MRIKTALLTALAVCFLSSAALAMEPDLIGTWSGVVVAHIKGEGFVKNEAKGQWIFTEVKDGAFTGKKVWNRTGQQREEIFSGVISQDGKRLYIAEHEDGLLVGDVLSPDRIVLYYVENGPKAKAVRFDLKRVQ